MPLLAKVSFPDQEVEDFRFSPQECRLEIRMSGAWLDVEGGLELGASLLVIGGWTGTQARTYDPGRGTWEEQALPTALRDLCEAEFSEELVVLRGFTKDTGLWTELGVTHASTLELQVGD